MTLEKVYDELYALIEDLKREVAAVAAGETVVSVTQVLTEGTKIGTVTVDGTGTDLFAPTPPPAPEPKAARGVEILVIETGTNTGDEVNTSDCDTEHVYALALLLQKAPTAVNAISLNDTNATVISRKDVYVDANHSATVIFFTLENEVSAVTMTDFPEISASEKNGYCLFQLNDITADEIPTSQSDFQVLATKDQDGDVFTTISQADRDVTLAVVVDGNKYSYGILEMADPETEAFQQDTACNLKAKATTIKTQAMQVYMNCNQSYAQGFALTFDKVTPAPGE